MRPKPAPIAMPQPTFHPNIGANMRPKPTPIASPMTAPATVIVILGLPAMPYSLCSQAIQAKQTTKGPRVPPISGLASWATAVGGSSTRPAAGVVTFRGPLLTNAHSVNGIGDRAFEYSASGTAGGGIAIFVYRYNVVMMIAVDPTSDSSTVEQLARTAVSRLVAPWI